ncbi:hypothetical protein LCGC14_1501470 [marine sediment metagenome]|uniref:Uncharacterized protein n=1 Tax=marine sediment metagenome TaxID=412755 RepID=A0A0F9JPU9_9ZZZZ
MSEKNALIILVFSLWCLVLFGAKALQAIKAMKVKDGNSRTDTR